MKKSDVIKKCQNCGGNIIFSPLFQCLLCENCGTKTSIEFDKDYSKHAYIKDFNEIDTKELSRTHKDINCQNCGALVDIKDLQISKKCPYCDAPVVLDVFNEEVKPDAIIPFKFDKKQASLNFVTGIKHKWFLPNKFKKSPPLDTIEAFYFPAFAFDEKTRSVYSGILEYDEVNRDSEGRTYITVHTQPISGNYNYDYTDVLIECSSKLIQSQIFGVEPYYMSESIAFQQDFLRGYEVESYNTRLSDCKVMADDIIDSSIKRSILSRYTFTRVVSFNVQTSRIDEKYHYTILPIYKFNYNYAGKNYITYMNGQTGKVDNNLPKSKVKITFFVLGILLIIVGIVVLSMLFGDYK